MPHPYPVQPNPTPFDRSIEYARLKGQRIAALLAQAPANCPGIWVGCAKPTQGGSMLEFHYSYGGPNTPPGQGFTYWSKADATP